MSNQFSQLSKFIGSFLPAGVHVGVRERLRSCVGAGIGIVWTALISRWLLDAGALHCLWLAAPLGASAVLVFAVPASPLAQPWAVVGGNTISALVGVVCAMYIGDAAWAGGIAVGLSIAVMFSLRCLHPPGGATALLTALSGAGFMFAVSPMLFNSILLVLAGVLYNRVTGRRYPHAQVRATQASTPAATSSTRFTPADLDAALDHYNQVLDVSRDDLEELLHFAEAASYKRNFGDLRCMDIMSAQPVSVQFGTSLDEAWKLMRERRIKALPVTDRVGRIVGIVTVADFLRQVNLDTHQTIGERLRAFVSRDGLVHSDKPEVVGQIMTRQVRVATGSRHLSELVPLFSEGGHHHIPIIDDDKRLIGIVTESDVVRALYRAPQVAA